MHRIRQAGRFFLTGDRWLVTAFALLLVYYASETLGFFTTMSEDVVGPATFPRLLAVFGGILVVLYFLQKRREPVEAPEEAESGKFIGEGLDLIPVLLTVVYVLFLEQLGFLVATFLFITVTMRFLGQDWKGAMGYSVGLTIVIFIVFYYGLRAQIPMGTWIPTEDLLPFLVDLRRAIGG